MLLPAFDPPGFLDDLNADQKKQWSNSISDDVNSEVAGGCRRASFLQRDQVRPGQRRDHRGDFLDRFSAQGAYRLFLMASASAVRSTPRV